MINETVFTWGAPALKFGLGAVDEVGPDTAALLVRAGTGERSGVTRARVLVVTDAGVASTGTADRVCDTLKTAGLEPVIFTGVHIEPTDASMRQAVEFARDSDVQAFVAVGGGSCIDTAKVADLLSTQPGDLLEYVNKPVGGGRKVERPLRPLVAVPTTAGTGAECTPVAVLDVLSASVKTGISDPALRPALAVVDPSLTVTMPPEVTAASGLDVLCHALESFTAKPFDAFERKGADQRVAYCGANPVSDTWVERTLPLVARSLRAAVHDGSNLAARHDMALAAMFAGMGFGNAGVHIPHACAYPIAGRVRDYHPAAYPGDEPMVPHGQAVALTAPAAFRFTYSANPDRHLLAADLLEPDGAGACDPEEERLAGAVTRLMRDVGIPNGLGAVRFSPSDVPDLVEGALQQQRLLSIAPKDPARALEGIFRDSFEIW